MKTHKLKLLQKYYDATDARLKQFEIRKNDRNYQIGDELRLLEWDGECFTGRELLRGITYMTDYAQKPGYLVLGVL